MAIARRQVISLLGWLTLSAAAGIVLRQKSSSSSAQVIVIGAGIAGLAAAQLLKSQGIDALVLEGRHRIGGRIWTDRSLGMPMDMGASWIHGPDGNNPITPLAHQARAQTFMTDENNLLYWDHRGNRVGEAQFAQDERAYEQLLEQIEKLAEQLPTDITIEQAIRRINPQQLQNLAMQYRLTAYMEFDTGGPIEKLSARYWQADENFPGNDVLFPAGYDAITNRLSRGLNIKTNHIVRRIEYAEHRVRITTDQGDFTAARALIALPLGVLKSGKVQFHPPLPDEMTRTLQKMAVGTVNKVALLFPSLFWDETTQYFGYESTVKGQYPYFLNARTFSPTPALITFGLGNYGLTMEQQTDPQIVSDVMAHLRIMFGKHIPNPTQVLVSRWTSDPFAGGAYSYAAVGVTNDDFTKLGQTVAGTLFFAGEHTHAKYRATVHGAYLSGQRAA
ncbi:MAG: FAD-dependent oxidoreductase, partial [Gloeomargarita sp. DG_1_5_bins_55]